MNKVSRRWAPTSDIDSVSFVESLSDSDADDLRFVFLLLFVIYMCIDTVHLMEWQHQVKGKGKGTYSC